MCEDKVGVRESVQSSTTAESEIQQTASSGMMQNQAVSGGSDNIKFVWSRP